MKNDLTADLVSEFNAIKKDFLTLEDDAMRKELILLSCRNLSRLYDDWVATNTMNIIKYYLSAGRVDIEVLIKYLTANNDLDYETIQREERDGFDKMFGTTTSLILRQYELPEKISLHRFETSGRCHPSPVTSVKMALKNLTKYNVKYDEFVFIDVGAGLGRNLLLASDYPFRKIIGIEQSQYLTNMTKENISIYQSKTKGCDNFDIQCIDALKYEFPYEHCIFYFWRPFSDEIAVEFVKKLELFIKNTSFNVILIFLGMVYPSVKASTLLVVLDIFYTPDLLGSNGEHFPISVYSNKNYNAHNNYLKFKKK